MLSSQEPTSSHPPTNWHPKGLPLTSESTKNLTEVRVTRIRTGLDIFSLYKGFCFVLFSEKLPFQPLGYFPTDLFKIHPKTQLLKYQLHISINEGHQNPRSMRICLSNCVSVRTPCFTWIWNSHNRHLSLQLKGWLCWRSYSKLNYKDILGEGEFSFSTNMQF